MKCPHIDKRTKEDLINYIKQTAQYYSPEWRFNEDDMDMGSVLSIIFVNMFKGTIDRFNEVPYKNFINFLNIINTKLLPSITAEGYITFNLVNGINEGVFVKKGEKLSAKSEDSERIVFETEKNIYVTPSKINYIYNCSYNNDSIIKIFDYEENEKAPAVLFSKKGENLQKHEMIIKHKDILNLTKSGEIKIFFHIEDYEKQKEVLNVLSSMGKWSYLKGSEYIPLNSVINNGDSLLITKDFSEDINKSEKIDKSTLGTIKCRIGSIRASNLLAADKILLSSKADDLLPDVIFSKSLECENKGFYVFSESFSVYDDFSVSCKEAFLKKKAHITISFNMELIKVPIQDYTSHSDIDWKYIMKKSALKQPEEYEISIAEVIWEYWNGIGWSKLKLDMDYSRIFNFEGDFQKRRVKLQFTCPEDMEETIVNSYEGLFIRARILRVNNEFRIHGFYISPYIELIRIDYEYLNEIPPEQIEISNNMVNKIYTKDHMENEEENITIFERLQMQNNISYFAFDKKPEGSPIRILFSMENVLPKERPILVWEYWNGFSWKILNLVDGTENMRKSGLVSFSGEEDFEKRTLFNKNMYWIRIYNLSSQYENDKIIFPSIKKIFMNTVQILQQDSKGEELFFIDAYEKNKKINLINKNINTVEVWVNEYGDISHEETINISKNNIRIIRNEIGEVKEIWVKWRETDDFIASDENQRSYFIDRNIGEIYFGNGINGKIPTSNKVESIKVIYSVGGGDNGNVGAEQITAMERSIGYINKIFNPLPTGGGCNMESIDEAVKRAPFILKNRNKAVTCEDYENLAREGFRNISKVKCFSGLNDEGEREPGAVTLVVLPKGIFFEDLYFNQLSDQIKLYLKERNSSLLNKKHKLNIILTCFISISVKVEAETYDMDNIFAVKQEIEDTLTKFIDPLRGNFHKEGWEIGEFPVREKIVNCLKYVNGIKRISNIIVSASTNNKGRIEDIDIEKYKKNIYGIPLNGVHIVKVHADNDLLF